MTDFLQAKVFFGSATEIPTVGRSENENNLEESTIKAAERSGQVFRRGHKGIWAERLGSIEGCCCAQDNDGKEMGQREVSLRSFEEDICFLSVGQVLG